MVRWKGYILVTLNMAVLPVDEATCTDVHVAPSQSRGSAFRRNLFPVLKCRTPDLNGHLVNLVELAEGVYPEFNTIQA
jgi:hypothetical protein